MAVALGTLLAKLLRAIYVSKRPMGRLSPPPVNWRAASSSARCNARVRGLEPRYPGHSRRIAEKFGVHSSGVEPGDLTCGRCSDHYPKEPI